MKFSYKNSLHSALKSSFIILKLVIPIYILADILFYYNLLSHVSFLVKPITSFLDLPTEAALSIISGMFLNLYAAIAFAAPLGLSPREWTILGVFLGICHALIVETVVMKKLGISKTYSITLRIFVGLFVAYITTLLPNEWFAFSSEIQGEIPISPEYTSVIDLLYTSIFEAFYLSFQIIILISALIFVLDYIKSLRIIQKYTHNVNSAFSLGIGVILGITYGAGILIGEYEKNTLSKKDILFIGTFLMICHAIIEDTLLFVIFGANFWIIVLIRTLFAFVFAWFIVRVLRSKLRT